VVKDSNDERRRCAPDDTARNGSYKKSTIFATQVTVRSTPFRARCAPGHPFAQRRQIVMKASLRDDTHERIAAERFPRPVDL